MKERRTIILAVLIISIAFMETAALMYYLTAEKPQLAYIPSYPPASSNQGAYTSAPVSRPSTVVPFRHGYQGASAYRTHQTNTPNYQPTVSTGWQLYRTSSQTVQSIGGGKAAASQAGTTMSSTSRGIQVSSAPMMAMSTMPLAVRNLQAGMTAEQGLKASAPRRTLIYDGSGEDDYGDENLRPGTDPTDPFFTPVGDSPWWLLLLLAFAYVAIKKLRPRSQFFDFFSTFLSLRTIVS